MSGKYTVSDNTAKGADWIICRLLFFTGILRLLNEVVARQRITIINYHNPAPEVFDLHARYFSRHYAFVSIDEVVVALACGSMRTLPPRPLLITFDDGHAGNAELFPIFQRYNLPVVIYAVAGLIGTRRQFWFDLVPHHSTAMVRLKTLPDQKRRDLMRNDYGHWDERDYDRPSALSGEQLQAFSRSGGTVGSHTMFHPMLNRCDPETGRFECSASRALLEEIVGVPVRHFALPNGQSDERVLQWVRDAGYHSCRSIRPGRVKLRTSPFDLPNFGISDDADVPKAAVQACGLWDMVKKYVRNRSNPA